MKIRLMLPEDEKEVWELIKRNPEHIGGKPVMPPANSLVLLAEKDGKVVGGVELEKIMGGICTIHLLVDKEHQRKYVGWKLLEAVKRLCRWATVPKYGGAVKKSNERFLNMADKFPGASSTLENGKFRYYEVLV